MRSCPTVEASPSPIITHRIGTDVCQVRQGTFFHKCHRCIYRGKALDWEPESAPGLVIPAGAQRKNGVAAKPAAKPAVKPAPKKVPGKAKRAIPSPRLPRVSDTNG